jgi:hypothetical protein
MKKTISLLSKLNKKRLPFWSHKVAEMGAEPMSAPGGYESL